MELARYLWLLRKWWWLLCLGTLIAGGVSYGVSKNLTPVYSASATLLVNQTQVPGTIAYNDILTSERLTRTYKELIEKRPVLHEVVDRLGVPYDWQDLAGMISVGAIPDTQLLRLSVENADPSLASRLANSIASVFIEQNTENQLSRPGDVSIVEAATPPSRPVKPNVMLNTALAACIGLLLAGAIAFVFEYLDDTVKSAEDLETSGLTCLGGVARFHRPKSPQENLVAGSRSRHHLAEAYRILRTNVQFSTIDRPGQILLVTSANPGEGKSTTAANLALVMAQAGKRVLLIDSDLRRPSIHRLFELPNDRGLTNLLLSPHPSVNGCAQVTRHDNLAVITSGPLPPNPSELLASKRFDALLDNIKTQADVIILDSPPMLAVTDASILAAKSDGSLLIVDSNRTRAQAVRRAQEALLRSKTQLLGAVLNKLKLRGAGDYYYHYYQSPKGSSRTRANKRGSRAESGAGGGR